MSTLPAFPASIPANTNLAELEHIRAGWLAQARAEQAPERLFKIGLWLGRIVDTMWEGTHRELIIGNVRIAVGVRQTGYNIASDAWDTVRKLYVYSGGNLVVSWSWQYVTQSIQDAMPDDAFEGAGLLYIPGDWVATAMSAYERAEKARIGAAQSAEFAERESLAKRLLVGVRV